MSVSIGQGHHFFWRPVASLVAGLLLLATPALADVTAVYEAGRERITIEYRDDNHIRMKSPDGSFIVVTGGKGYIASREGGQWRVLSLDEVAAVAGAFAAAAQPQASNANVTLRDTGRSETVAGIRGRVHEAVVSDGWGDDETMEMVLSDDANAKAAFRGIQRITDLMGQMAQQHGFDALTRQSDAIGNRAVLRAGNDWRLASVQRGSIPDRHFTLPAEPTSLGQAAGVQEGGWLQRLAEEFGGTAADETRGIADEAREETRRGVSDEVRQGIRGLFGR